MDMEKTQVAEKFKEGAVQHMEDGYDDRTSSVDHVSEATSSPSKALFMLLKAFIGTGVIFLPGSFASGGLVLSIVLMVIIGVVCLISFRRLVDAHETVGGSYGHVAEVLMNRWAKYIIQFFLCISQMGFVASYMIFISSNVDLVIKKLNHCFDPIAAHYYIWIFLAVIAPLCWVRKIGRIGWCAIVADIFILFGLICVIYFSAHQIHDQGGMGPNMVMVNSNDFALMIGTAVFSFEGIGMVVPVKEGMKDPAKFKGVVTVGTIICIVVFTFIGAFGYAAFGDQIQSNIVYSLPQTPLSTTVQLVYAIAMILTSPFMLYPPLTIIEEGLFKPHHRGQTSLKWKWLKNLVRTIIPVICAAVSFGVGADGLGKFVALVGSVACMPLCFVFPGLFHMKIAKTKFQKLVDVILIVFGVAMAIYTIVVNVESWLVPATPSTVSLCTA